MNARRISSNYLPHRNFLSGHNAVKVTYQCMFFRHQCIHDCKYSCKSQWYCCRASSRDKRVMKRCIHQHLEEVAISKSHGKCLKRKYFRDSPKGTKRLRNKKTTKKKRKKRTNSKKKRNKRKVTKRWKKTKSRRKKMTNRRGRRGGRRRGRSGQKDQGGR